jgi:hypothetical protein
LTNKRFGFATCGAVPNGDRLDVSHFQDRPEKLFRFRFSVFGLEVKDGIAHEFSGVTHDGKFATCTNSGIDTEHGLRSERGREEKFFYVFGEYFDRSRISDFF